MQPNVLLITTDHWPAHLLGCAGNPYIQSPTLDALAMDGVRFANASSECPVCIPARRSLMTGMSPRQSGCRRYHDNLRMPDAVTLAQAFRNAGYQAFASGKLHVYPQRSRIGFDDVMLVEEGRMQYGGLIDDYAQYLGEQGHTGEWFGHGMGNNDYETRPWHLDERHHVTNWITRECIRQIKRRDPGKPGFWYMSHMHPHPPLIPPPAYWDMYKDEDPGDPVGGGWAADPEAMPYRLRGAMRPWMSPKQIRRARQAFYALCTHIDHQLRLVLGTLREEKLLDNTIICFTADHGDLLGQHGVWGKSNFLQPSTNVPLLVSGVKGDDRTPGGTVENRLVGLADVMPTLLDLAGISIPESCDGISMVSDTERDVMYGEINEGAQATRMLRDERYKLIYYAEGNRFQLFDLESDPDECNDLYGSKNHAAEASRLQKRLQEHLYGADLDWIQDGQWKGLPAVEGLPRLDRNLVGQRGLHWPPYPSGGDH